MIKEKVMEVMVVKVYGYIKWLCGEGKRTGKGKKTRKGG